MALLEALSPSSLAGRILGAQLRNPFRRQSGFLVVDIGSSSVKLAGVEHGASGPRISSLGMAPLPPTVIQSNVIQDEGPVVDAETGQLEGAAGELDAARADVDDQETALTTERIPQLRSQDTTNEGARAQRLQQRHSIVLLIINSTTPGRCARSSTPPHRPRVQLEQKYAPTCPGCQNTRLRLCAARRVVLSMTTLSPTLDRPTNEKTRPRYR